MMDSHSVSPFFLPAELRLKIYKYAWTVPEEKYIYRSKTFGNMNDGDGPYDEYNEYDSDGYYAGERDNDNALRVSVTYVRAQLSAISKLGAISQRIRAEVYPEYLGYTQIVLRYDAAWSLDGWIFHGGPGWVSRKKSALYILGGSYLLQTQARHVYLHWPARAKRRIAHPTHVLADQEELLNEQWAVDCVSRFKNLRSLVVHVDDASDIGPLTDIHWNYYVNQLDHPNADSPAYYSKEAIRPMFYGKECRVKLMEGLLKTHRWKLEKVVMRTDISSAGVVKLMNEHEAFESWRQLKTLPARYVYLKD